MKPLKTLLVSAILLTSFNTLAEVRNDLNGLRVQSLGGGTVFLIDEGRLRGIPNSATYNNLFAGWNGIHEIDINNIDRGKDITNGAILGTCGGAVFLIDQGQKRGLVSHDVMTKYHFNWNNINHVNCLFLDYMPSGRSIINPS
jgi:hypothetical protein